MYVVFVYVLSWCGVRVSCWCLTWGVTIIILLYIIHILLYILYYTHLPSSDLSSFSFQSFPSLPSSSHLPSPLLFFLSQYSSLLFYLQFSSSFLSILLPIIFLPIPLRLSLPEYLSALGSTYLYSTQLQTIRPRMFYRSGWLRCVSLKCIGFMFRAGVMCLTLGVYICIYYILLLYYILLYYTIISYTYLILYSSSSSDLSFFSPLPFPLLILYSPLHPFLPYSSIPSCSSSLSSSFPFLFASHSQSSSLLFSPSKYTCRVFLMFIYVRSHSRISDPACFIGVDGWGV